MPFAEFGWPHPCSLPQSSCPYCCHVQDPNYNARRHQRLEEGGELNFLEAVFSFVFGDGDPNARFDAHRWASLAAYIQSK